MVWYCAEQETTELILRLPSTSLFALTPTTRKCTAPLDSE